MMISTLGILSVFLTIDGEANYHSPGVWSVFVRTRGCTVGCHWCDTKYSWQQEGGEDFTPEQLVHLVAMIGGAVRKVTITGGEPLEQDWGALREFIRQLHLRSYDVTVETAGTEDTLAFRKFQPGPVFLRPNRLSFVVDYKLGSSNYKGEMNISNFTRLRYGDVVKFVIDDEEDLAEAANVARLLRNSIMFQGDIYFSPSHNHMEPELLVHKMRGLNMPDLDVRLNMQVHKYIWPEDVRTEEDTGVDFTKRSLGRDEYLRRVRGE